MVLIVFTVESAGRNAVGNAIVTGILLSLITEERVVIVLMFVKLSAVRVNATVSEDPHTIDVRSVLRAIVGAVFLTDF